MDCQEAIVEEKKNESITLHFPCTFLKSALYTALYTSEVKEVSS